ncbi:MAG: hypothetical protein ABI780_10175 [Ardenticatenales bacterium]
MVRRTLTLLGPDVMLYAMGGGRPNNAVLVAECDGRLAASRVEGALDALRPLAPYMSSRLERPFPWGRLRWTATDERPPVVRRLLRANETVDEVIDEVLNQQVDPRREPPLRWTVVESSDGGRSWLLLAWVHPLMDPRGAELLIAMLAAVDRGGEAHAWAVAQPTEAPADQLDARARRRLARQALDRLRAIGSNPPPSLGRGVASSGPVRHRRLVVPALNRQLPVTLALVGGAMASLWRARGLPLAQPFLVPISVDRRRVGEAGPVFGNYLSFHFARFTPAATEDVATTAVAIRRDMADAVRADLVEAVWAGMGFARYSPARQLLRPFGGEAPASFHCADTGEVRPPLTTLCGAAVRGGYHVSCVQPHPGLGVFFSRRGATESIVAVWVQGVVTTADVDHLLDAIRSSIAALAA